MAWRSYNEAGGATPLCIEQHQLQGLSPSPSSTATAGRDITLSARFEEHSSTGISLDMKEMKGDRASIGGGAVRTVHTATSTSSPVYAAVGGGIMRGSLVVVFKLESDVKDEECSCFGVCRRPVSSCAYDGTKDMWLWRSYNGYLYAQGVDTTAKAAKVHAGDLVKLQLDMDRGELHGWVNDTDCGVLFSGLPRRDGPLAPCVQFYSSGRAVSIQVSVVL